MTISATGSFARLVGVLAICCSVPLVAAWGYQPADEVPDSAAEAATEPAADGKQETGPTGAEKAGDALDPAERDRRERVVSAAALLVAGIAVVGLALIAMTVLLGSRLRRIARAPLPRQSVQDDLWYLRGKKRPEADAEEEAPATDDEG